VGSLQNVPRGDLDDDDHAVGSELVKDVPGVGADLAWDGCRRGLFRVEAEVYEMKRE
jgi:hypothetical protein